MHLFTPETSVMLLIDHQSGTLGFCRNIPKRMIIQNTRALARIADVLEMPLVLTSSQEDQPQGPLIDDMEELAPAAYAARIKRSGIANAWEDPEYKAAVLAAAGGRKDFIVGGLTNDVCIAYPVRSMVEEGYNVVVVQDAGGSPSQIADDAARRFWEAAGARTTTVNALAAELGKDWSSPRGSKIAGIIFQEVISKLDEMSKF